MTDVPLDIVTGLLFGATTATAIVAAVGIHKAEGATTKALEAQREQGRDQFRAELLLRVSDDVELYQHNTDSSVASRVRAALAGLPATELPTVRRIFGAALDETPAPAPEASSAGGAIAAMRQEIRLALGRLGTLADQSRTSDDH